jgi:hypothetical protein
MENKNYSILLHVFIYKTKYPTLIVICVTILGRYNSGGMETKGIGKSEGTSTMKTTCL